MNVAIIGCGYVADQYMKTLSHRAELPVVGCFDIDKSRLQKFCDFHKLKSYESLDSLLQDNQVEMVVNLTNPRSHFDVTSRSLAAGKHVYSEKPIGMTLEEATKLADIAKQNDVRLASAPCNVLGRTVQTVWKAINDGVLGETKLIYGSYEAGYLAPHYKPWNWQSSSGAYWPAKDEFEIGCTFEHAGYLLVPLLSIFGPVAQVTSFASCVVPDKGIEVESMAPDTTIGILEFANSNVFAKITCGISAPKEKRLVIVGSEATLFVETFRDDLAPVYIERNGPPSRTERRLERAKRLVEGWLPSVPWGGRQFRFRKRYPFACDAPPHFVDRSKRVDFTLGMLEFANAISEDRTCRLDADLGVHVVELIHALQYPNPSGKQQLKTKFESVQPLAWK